jgi:hypothetical protein
VSTEFFLLVVFLLLLPLIELLIGALRRAGGRTSEPPAEQPAPPHRPPMRERQPPAETPARPAPAAPRGPAAARRRLAEAKIPREEETVAAVARIPWAARRGRRRARLVSLQNPAELRRAMVLTTILGPCRAVSPQESPESAGRR